MNQVQLEDSQIIGNLEFIDWEQFRNRVFLITGSTGLIGSNLVNALAYNSQTKGLGIKLLLPVRNVRMAEEEYRWTNAEIFQYEIGEQLKVDNSVDYIVHLASPTNSRFFIEKPVDTLRANIDGYIALLEWAKAHPVKKFIGVSTMEVYGFPKKGQSVTEADLGAFEPMNGRNSYPIAKIACEALCNAYWLQYGVPSVILRATQTFGPGVRYDDERVFAQFMRCVVENKDIVLKTTGETTRSYLYTADAVSAILVGIMRGESGQSYTIANPDTFCSIRTMAQLVASEIAGDQIRVIFDLAENEEKLGFAKTLYMNLDVGKMLSLEWNPSTDLKTMFERMIRGVKDNEQSSCFNEHI